MYLLGFRASHVSEGRGSFPRPSFLPPGPFHKRAGRPSIMITSYQTFNERRKNVIVTIDTKLFSVSHKLWTLGEL